MLAMILKLQLKHRSLWPLPLPLPPLHLLLGVQ